MFELQEYRYPFESLFDFVNGGYWTQIEALHLTLGWVFIIFFVLYTLRSSASLQLGLSIPYFALALFMNPAYEVYGLKVNEIFGVLAALHGLAMGLAFQAKKTPVVSAILMVFVVGFAHSMIAVIVYPNLIVEDHSLIMRVGVVFKIFVLGINLLIVGFYLRRGIGLEVLLRGIIYAAVFGLLMYLLQLAILVGFKTFPYGSYLDAGFVGVPAFGSVAEERGHFGKFMTPLFPFFAYALIRWRWRLRFALFVLVTLINVSASSLMFFFSYVLISLWVFRRRVATAKAFVSLSIAFFCLIAVVVYFNQVFIALIAKIYFLVIVGDETAAGGRSFSTFLQYITTYPFGIGYGGSSLRTPPGMPEINSGIFAFISQYSLLAMPLILGFLWLVYSAVQRAKAGRTLLGKAMAIGVICSPIIFASDILWFVPTIWLAFEIAWAMPQKSGRAILRKGGNQTHDGQGPVLLKAPIASER